MKTPEKHEQPGRKEHVTRRVRSKMKRMMVAGLLTLVPVAATFIVLRWVLVWMDSIAAPVIRGTLGIHIPGLGILLTLTLVLLVGLLATNVFSRKVIEWAETTMMRLPIVKIVYNPVKKLLGTFAQPNENRTWKTVLVEYPRKGAWMIAFVAGEMPGSSGEVLSVFVPNTPNPAAGRVLILPRKEVHSVNIPIDDAIEFIVSGGTAIASSFLALPMLPVLSNGQKGGVPKSIPKSPILPGIDESSV